MYSIPENILAGWQVVVIDDEPDAIEVAQILLEMYGAKVIAARNGREGLELIQRVHPRFVITDISMPEMTGWDLIEQMQLDRSTSEIPVVALTAHAMSGDRERAIARGFHNYLVKPLRPETFVGELLNLLVDNFLELKQVLSSSQQDYN